MRSYRRGIRFADEDKIPLDVFMKTKTKLDRLFGVYLATTKQTQSAVKAYQEDIKKYIEGMKEAIELLKKNRMNIDTTRSIMVGQKISDLEKDIKLLEGRYLAAKEFWAEMLK